MRHAEINMVRFATKLCMGNEDRIKKQADLDEREWEADMEGRLMEDDPKEDR